MATGACEGADDRVWEEDMTEGRVRDCKGGVRAGESSRGERVVEGRECAQTMKSERMCGCGDSE
jgi:hypothetical protein